RVDVPLRPRPDAGGGPDRPALERDRRNNRCRAHPHQHAEGPGTVIPDPQLTVVPGRNLNPWGARNRSLVMLRVRIRGSGRRGDRGGGSAWRLAVRRWLGALTARVPTGRGWGGGVGRCQ